jgi:polysaccharide export outer membrane protein
VLQHGDKIYVPPDESKVYVVGEVNSPGFFPYTDGLTLYEAIEMAGGFTDFANKKKIRIRRESDDDDEPTEIRVNLKELLKKGDISRNVTLNNGDIIVVGSSFFF